MPEFTYAARDASGNLLTGAVNARDAADAAVRVRALGAFPTRIQGANGHASVRTREGGARPQDEVPTRTTDTRRIPRLQILLFTREMADLLDAGLPMDRALSVLIEQTEHEGVATMLRAMQADIRAGQPLSAALQKFPREFPPLFANMVHAGEVSGQLATVMGRLADFLEKEQTRRSQILAALAYPAVLTTVAVVAVTFLLTFVIPRLSAVFRELKASLPLPTRMLLGISGFIGQYWWAIAICIVGAFYGFRAWLQTSAGRKSFDGARLQAPVIGPLTRKIVFARLVRTLGTLLAGGVPILESLEISASGLGNVVASDLVLAARDRVRQGETLHNALNESGPCLPVVLQMTAVGEETGRLPQMLGRTAETLDFEVDNTMRRLTSLVEPLVVLAMGCFVGFIVLSILLPIFQASSLVK